MWSEPKIDGVSILKYLLSLENYKSDPHSLFAKIVDATFDFADIQPKLLEWEKMSNNVRPNQDNNYLTLAVKVKLCHFIHKKEEHVPNCLNKPIDSLL